MLELVATRVAAVACHAAPDAADAAMSTASAYACRIAPDEVLLLGKPGAAAKLVEAASKKAGAADPDALVLDTTDGWTVWTLEGNDAREAFARLSAVPLPEEGFTQGDVAHVPVKVVAFSGRLHLLVPAMWGAFLRERIVEVGLPVHERSEPVPWAGPDKKRGAS
jgi:sarcosine oxidase gamma subunit